MGNDSSNIWKATLSTSTNDYVLNSYVTPQQGRFEVYKINNSSISLDYSVHISQQICCYLFDETGFYLVGVDSIGGVAMLYHYDHQGQLLNARNVIKPNGDYVIWGNNIYARRFEDLFYIVPRFINIPANIIAFDANTLELVAEYPTAPGGLVFNETKVTSVYNEGYVEFTDSSFIIYGTAYWTPGYDPSIPSSIHGPMDFQYVKYEQMKDTALNYSLTTYGPDSIDNRGYAAGKNPSNGTYAFTGALPFDNTPIFAAEERKVVVYLEDHSGVFDTLHLFGDGNHVPNYVHCEPNGDLYLGGSRSDAWSTGKEYYWFTKIPEVVLRTIEVEEMQPTLEIYPNPTVQNLQIKDEEQYLNGTIKVFNMQGQLVLQAIYRGGEINISHLQQGNYLLHLSKGSKEYNTLFVKQ